jgi:O-6-methylguanine DNA methyltransferase
MPTYHHVYQQCVYSSAFKLWVRAEWTHNDLLFKIEPILIISDQNESGNAPARLITHLLDNMEEVRFGKQPVLKLASSRSVFEENIRQALWQIKPGNPMTYGQIARNLNKPGGAQAVGQACARNSLTLIVPCHRIIGAHSLGGYRWGLPMKQKLLEIEAN